MSYNMRPVVSDFTVTAAVNGTTSVAVSGGNIGLFKNGDGILIPGAGPANGISTRAAPTVTPSLIAGLDNLNNTVAAPSGGAPHTIIASAPAARGKVRLLAPQPDQPRLAGRSEQSPGRLVVSRAPARP